MKQRPLFRLGELIQYGGLVFAILFVGLAYATVIRPTAEKQSRAAETTLLTEEETGPTLAPRSIFILLKDYEQQICLTLVLWAAIILGHKFLLIRQERQVLERDFLRLEKGERIIPEESLNHYHEVQQHLEEQPIEGGYKLLPEVIGSALHRFHATHSIQDASQAINEQVEMAAGRLDAELSLIRYIAWAIPSVGFIGTVRGIGEALGRADEAIKGDISGVTAALGLAFNSTLIALFLSIVLMFFVYLLQSRQEGLILEIEAYCRKTVVALMKVPLR